MAGPSEEPIPLRKQLAVYATAMFSDGSAAMIVPLWTITLDPSPLAFGLVVGARAALPLLFAIHGGSMMDRLGVRRVMLWFAVIGLILPILFPLMPWVWAAGILQLITGFTTTMSWIGAQAMVGKAMKGGPRFAGRLSFSNRVGQLLCPLVSGFAWDEFGPWGGFGTMFAWAVFLFAAALALPKPDAEEAAAEGLKDFRAGDLVPKLSDYTAALKLLAIPAVSMVAIASVLNIATGAIQFSFYIDYVTKVGISATGLGTLTALANIIALLGTAGMSRLMRWVREIDLLNFSVMVSIITITVTPLMERFIPLMFTAALRGWSQGISQPLMISVPARAVPPSAQGLSIGLRISLNRIVQTALPPLMGVVVQVTGLEHSFFLIGGVLLVLISIILVRMRLTLPPEEGRL
jgi:MFS family permease